MSAPLLHEAGVRPAAPSWDKFLQPALTLRSNSAHVHILALQVCGAAVLAAGASACTQSAEVQDIEVLVRAPIIHIIWVRSGPEEQDSNL